MAEKGIQLDSQGRVSLQAALEVPKPAKTRKACEKCGGLPPLHTNDCPLELHALMVRYGGRRHDENIDPDKAGGIRFVSEAFSAAPKEKKKLKWDLEKLPPLSPKLKGIEVVLLQDILLRAYKFATSGGRIKLRDLNKLQTMAKDQGGMAKLASLLKGDLSESARALEALVKGQGSMKSHLEKLRQFVHSGFASQIARLQITNIERDLLVYHLVHDTEEGFHKVEQKDPGVTQYMLKMLIEELKEMKMFPEELEERFGLSAHGET